MFHCRFTNPKDFASMLDELPEDVLGICEVSKRQTIHHNLLPYYGIPSSKWKEMRKIWPPRTCGILSALKDTEPHNLSDVRQPIRRVIGACVLESRDPNVDELVKFYRESETLRIESAEKDPYSFVFRS